MGLQAQEAGHRAYMVEGQPITVSTTIPLEVQRALQINEHVRRGDWSVTELLDNPRCARLKRMFPEEKREDPATLVSAFIGSASHERLQRFTDKQDHMDTVTTEDPLLITTKDNRTVSGSCDFDKVHVMENGVVHLTIRDYKHWKTFKWGDDKWDDVFWQLQFYFLMKATQLRKNGVALNWTDEPVGLLQATIIFLDWNKRDAAVRRADYPPTSVVTLEFKPLPLQAIANKMRERINAHAALENVPEDQWPDATPEDVWNKLDAVKVYKPGSDRACAGGVFEPSKCGGNDMAMEAAKAKAQEVGGTAKACWLGRKRCASYCSVSGKCSTYQKYLTENPQDKE